MWSRQCHCPRGGLAHGNPRRRRTGVLAPGAREREELVGHDVVFNIGVADVGVEGNLTPRAALRLVTHVPEVHTVGEKNSSIISIKGSCFLVAAIVGHAWVGEMWDSLP